MFCQSITPIKGSNHSHFHLDSQGAGGAHTCLLDISCGYENHLDLFQENYMMLYADTTEYNFGTADV